MHTNAWHRQRNEAPVDPFADTLGSNINMKLFAMSEDHHPPSPTGCVPEGAREVPEAPKGRGHRLNRQTVRDTRGKLVRQIFERLVPEIYAQLAVQQLRYIAVGTISNTAPLVTPPRHVPFLFIMVACGATQAPAW